jgi:glycosyltransferase involved in cell wall biosynthesis
MRVLDSPSLADLVAEYKQATLFVLATRTRFQDRTNPSGEGFGIVLAEAQLTGLPVVAPASGGSNDAYLDGLTGTRPSDETPKALAATITGVLAEGQSLQRMSENAAIWAAARYDPDRFASLAYSVLVEQSRSNSLPLSLRPV